MKHNFALAVKAIIIKDDKILVLYRSKKEMAKSMVNKRESCDLPGGGVRFYETSIEGLNTEVYEETRLKVKVLDLFSFYDVLRPNLHLSLVTYLCEYESGELSLSWEHDRHEWIGKDDIDSSSMPEWMKRDFRKAFQKYAELKDH